MARSPCITGARADYTAFFRLAARAGGGPIGGLRCGFAAGARLAMSLSLPPLGAVGFAVASSSAAAAAAAAATAAAACSAASAARAASSWAAWHFLYFCPDPQWHGSFLPILVVVACMLIPHEVRACVHLAVKGLREKRQAARLVPGA